ncbi:hypothetical protein [Cyanobium sp. Cruz-8H5]|uniref:hypothetical protein n=1 Tax=Cyanobium sp. Cruz-8H5 TaxID=2823712 RepID=UPI0020CCC110|nr:hypothetical protein [Cyanobium sp. Cruz-8H5]MCP9861503.1 hypothetical protein [Cyanobium sp. Cruz-8H5]
MNTPARQVYCIFGGHALRYARTCLQSMLDNSLDPLHLTVITDGPEDVKLIKEAFRVYKERGHVSVFSRRDADERAVAYYKGLDSVAWFRTGHPCWLKITDPPLFSEPNHEMILVDPDVYFPNRFRFEQTPARGILLMRQKPNCLFPPNSVRATFRAGYAMADHTDIGVAQLVEPLSGHWLDELVRRVGRDNLPTWSMHIESIVWAAWAIHAGGGYLDQKVWKCWHNAHWKRMALRLGMPGWKAVASEQFESLKCLHATGPAKDMLMMLLGRDERPITGGRVEGTYPPDGYVRYPRWRFEAARMVKGPLIGLGRIVARLK